MATAERRYRLGQLRLAGVVDQRQLASLLRVNQSTVSRDLAALRRELIDTTTEQYADEKALATKRLNAALAAIWPRVQRGELLAIDRMVRIEERRAKLLGLDAPARVDIEGDVRLMAIETGIDPDAFVEEVRLVLEASPAARRLLGSNTARALGGPR
jgi:hypothetical protein